MSFLRSMGLVKYGNEDLNVKWESFRGPYKLEFGHMNAMILH